MLVDDNDRVKNGQVLARLDLSKLKDQVVKARAGHWPRPRPACCRPQASVKEAHANLARLRQVAELSGGKVPSKAELETAEADAGARRGRRGQRPRRGRAGPGATLSSDETNLSKAIIRSPIDGVVLTRKVEPGQTVAASFQAPVLFTLAEDLAKMELQVDVDEADVGQVSEGQPATFTVDAYPDRKYPAGHHARRLRLADQGRRRLLQDRAHGEQRRSQPAPGHDGHRRHHDGDARERAARAQRRAALHAASPARGEPAGEDRGGSCASLMPRPADATAEEGGGNGRGRRTAVWVLRGRPARPGRGEDRRHQRATHRGIVGGALAGRHRR